MEEISSEIIETSSSINITAFSSRSYQYKELIHNLAEKRARFNEIRKELKRVSRNLGGGFNLIYRPLTNEEFEKLYKQTTGKEIIIDSKLWLCIYLDKEREAQFVRMISNNIIPNIPFLEFRLSKEQCNLLSKFLENSLPDIWDRLYINFNLNNTKISNLIPSMLVSIPKIVNQFSLISVWISQNEFTKLMIAFSGCIEVSLSYSIIETDSEWDFSEIQTSNLQTLHLYSWGGK